MKKNYVLDTNILIHCPDALSRFEDNNIYLLHPVIEELDGLKDAPGETGYNAREAVRKICALREKGNLIKGVKTEGGGKVCIYVSESPDMSILPIGWSHTKQDNIILCITKELSLKKKNVILVSNDGNVANKGDFLGVEVQPYRNDQVKGTLYTGRMELNVSKDCIDTLADEGTIDSSILNDSGSEYIENEYLILNDNEGNSYLAKYKKGNIQKIIRNDNPPCGIYPRNAGQFFLMDACLSSAEEHPLVICSGPAGTGKTLISLACGLEQVMEQHKYKKVLIARPNITMDEEIGFLPGSEQEKISPLLRGCFDNLEILLGNKDDDNELLKDKIAELFEREYISSQAIAYLRGRSITNSFIIIDEAQNATANQILSIITRAGEGSKIVVLGDPDQIDNPRLNKHNCGISYAVQKMKGSGLTAICSFTEEECVRSPLAAEASIKLK